MATPSGSQRPSLEAVLDSPELVWGDVKTKTDGPAGALPLTDEMLRHWPSGDLFSLSQNAGMGWEVHAVARDPFLILSTQGGLRAPDGTPIALGYHTGHPALCVPNSADPADRERDACSTALLTSTASRSDGEQTARSIRTSAIPSRPSRRAAWQIACGSAPASRIASYLRKSSAIELLLSCAAARDGFPFVL